MKKIFAFILCAMLMCVLPIVASAEEASPSEEATEKTMTETIVDYVTSHVEEISVIATLAVTIFYEIRKHGKLNGSIGTLNNNAIAVAQNSNAAIGEALGEVKNIANVVKGYKDDIAGLLDEIRKTAEEKKSLEEMLTNTSKLLETCKAANIELADELADLLNLANIPNSVKEKIYSRHCAAVDAISAIGTAVEATTEVITDDGKET